MYTPIYKKDVAITNGFSSSHPQIDITGGFRSKKYALKPGIVEFVGTGYSYNSRYYNSPWYQIRYDDGYIVKEFHNSEVYIKAGQRVDNNTLVALEGNTGYVLTLDPITKQWRPPTPDELNRGVASHSHIDVKDPQGRQINPYNYISAIPQMPTNPVNNSKFYTVKIGGWRSNVIQEIIDSGIWQGTWQENEPRFLQLNQGGTPQGGWRTGDIVRVFEDAPVVTPTPVTPTPIVDNKELEKLKKDLENEKKKREEFEKSEAEKRQAIEEKYKEEIHKKQTELDSIRNQYNEYREDIEDKKTIDFPNNEEIELYIDNIQKELNLVDGFIDTWGRFIDKHFKGEGWHRVARGFFKWELLVGLTSGLGFIVQSGLLFFLTDVVGLDIPINNATTFILTVTSLMIGVIYKNLKVKYDKNKDGIVDKNDLMYWNENEGV